MPVVNDEGIVGRVLDVSDRYSRSPDHDPAVRWMRSCSATGEGVLSGKDGTSCVLKYVRATWMFSG